MPDLVAPAFAPPRVSTPRAVLFDAYGTFTRLLTTCNHGAHYRPFAELTRAALVFAIKKIVDGAYPEKATGQFLVNFGAQIEQLLAQYQHLKAFPENLAVLQTLKRRGIATGILSNGDPAMLHAAVQSAGLTGLLAHVVSVDAVRRFKTHPEAYALGEKALGLPAPEILFVSANAWDALGATWHGYTTLWVNRYHLPFEELGTQPTRTCTSLGDVLDFFPDLSVSIS